MSRLFRVVAVCLLASVSAFHAQAAPDKPTPLAFTATPRALGPAGLVQDPVVPPAPAEGMKIKAPKFAPPSTTIEVLLDGEKKEGDVIFWMVLRGREILGKQNVYELPGGSGLILSGDKYTEPYRVLLMFARDGKQQAPVIAEIQIGDPAPVPPKPDPVNPPKPDPVNPPAPIAKPVHALFILEEAQIDKDLADAVQSADFKKWMADNAEKDENGIPKCRVWDDDMSDEQILVHHDQKWVDAYRQAIADRAKAGKKDNDGWMLISNGSDGGSLSIPLPRERLYEYLNNCRQGKFAGN